MYVGLIHFNFKYFPCDVDSFFFFLTQKLYIIFKIQVSEFIRIYYYPFTQYFLVYDIIP